MINNNSKFSVMSTNCLHMIKLLNLHENDVITHQILLINGVVENINCSTVQEIELSAESLEILTAGLSRDTGRFKFLLDLGNENKKYELTFIYCKARLSINVIYQRREAVYKIQPLLILAKDEQEQCEKVKINQQIIDLNLLLIQSVYAEKLKEINKQRLTFVFNDKSQIFTTNLTKEEIYKLTEQDLWTQFAKELLLSDWGKRDELKFVAFINCTKYLGKDVLQTQDLSYQNIRKHIKGHAALGAGGLALFSTTYFYSWPKDFKNILYCFLNQRKLNLALEPDDSNYRKTRAGVYASSLGAVCHEIGHIFDLGHDLQGVMGSNFDYINRVFTLQTKTENLPERIVMQKPQKLLNTKVNFTHLKEPANGFLKRYREQQENDSFYFSPNTAIILSHHAWLRNDWKDFQSKTFEVHLEKSSGILKSLSIPLKIIEVRERSNSLVKEWFDLQKTLQEPVAFEFNLKTIKSNLTEGYYLFVMSLYGHSRKIDM